MKRIGNSKEPTTKQMLAMAENLMRKLGCHAVVETTASAYDCTGNVKIEYNLYNDAHESHWDYFDTWPELLSCYRKLMKGEKCG